MKKNFWLLLAALFLAVIPACEDSEVTPDEPDIQEDAELSLLPSTDYEFPAEGGDKTIMVTCNVDWTVESNQDWCTVAVTDATKFVISAGALTEEGITRDAATVTVTAGDVTKTIGITQKAFSANQELVFETANTTYTGTDFTITPSKDDIPYVVYTFPSFQYNDLSDDDLMTLIMTEAGSLDAAAVTGTYTYTNENLNNPATDYIVVAFGWEDNAVNGEFNKFTYSTEASSATSTTFTVSATDVGTTTATLNIASSEEYVTYFSAVYYTEGIDTYTQDQLNEQAVYYVQSYISYLDFGVREYGNTSTVYNLSHSTSFSVLVGCIDQYGDLTSDAELHYFCTTETPQYADGFNNWLGTWSMTSTSSELNGGPLSLDIVIAGGADATTYEIYGWELSGVRWDLPFYAYYDLEDGSFSMLSEEYIYRDDYNVGDVYQLGMAWIDAPYSAYYILTMATPTEIVWGTLGADGQSATIELASGTLSDGTTACQYTTIKFFLILDSDPDSYYTYTQDSSLGFTEYEDLVGPFTLTKISDSTILPEAPSKAMGTGANYSVNFSQPTYKAFNGAPLAKEVEAKLVSKF